MAEEGKKKMNCPVLTMSRRTDKGRGKKYFPWKYLYFFAQNLIFISLLQFDNFLHRKKASIC
jgi:hypothetical protein